MSGRNENSANLGRRGMNNQGQNYPQGPREPSLIDEMTRFTGPTQPNYGDVGRGQNNDQGDINEFNLNRHG